LTYFGDGAAQGSTRSFNMAMLWKYQLFRWK
jgi:TPP-dependent pyruvate/acetoin dehydrogenase alpha subunit